MNMIKTLFNRTLNTIEQLTIDVKEKFEKLIHRSTLSVSDIATFVMLHPDTRHEREEWLGLVFHFYHLQEGKTNIYLEMKGDQNKYILECKITDEHGIVSHYRSYEDKSVDSPLQVPQRLKSV